MMYITPSLQSQYLADLIKHQTPVALYLKNGRKFCGTVVGSTTDAIFFRDEMTEIFFKKMIHAILPIRQKVT